MKLNIFSKLILLCVPVLAIHCANEKKADSPVEIYYNSQLISDGASISLAGATDSVTLTLKLNTTFNRTVVVDAGTASNASTVNSQATVTNGVAHTGIRTDIIQVYPGTSVGAGGNWVCNNPPCVSGAVLQQIEMWPNDVVDVRLDFYLNSLTTLINEPVQIVIKDTDQAGSTVTTTINFQVFQLKI